VSATEGQSADQAGPAPGETDGYRDPSESEGVRGGPRGPRGSESCDQDRTEGGPNGSEGVRRVRGGPKGSEPFDQDRMGEIRPGRMSGCGWH
jgi:hypothetical protein